MKTHRLLLMLAVMMLFSTAITVLNAQNGATVIWGAGYGGMVFYNEEESIVSIHTTDANFFCGPDLNQHPTIKQDIFLPHDAVHLNHEHGELFTRVFWPAAPADLQADYCSFVNGDLLVAEGIAHYKGTDNNVTATPPRTDSYGMTILGPLYDLVGLCGDSGIVRFHLEYRARVDKNFEFITMNQHGPRLRCGGK